MGIVTFVTQTLVSPCGSRAGVCNNPLHNPYITVTQSHNLGKIAFLLNNTLA